MKRSFSDSENSRQRRRARDKNLPWFRRILPVLIEALDWWVWMELTLTLFALLFAALIIIYFVRK